MTHDELLAKMYFKGISHLSPVINTLRAVIELHKPDTNIAIQCQGCSSYWPCNTIQAIEKELE